MSETSASRAASVVLARPPSLRGPLMASAVFVVLGYGLLFLLPGTPFQPIGDQNFWLTEAHRTVRGEVLYRDFVEVIFPGVVYFFALVERMVGQRVATSAVTFLALGSAIAGLMFAIADRLVSRRAAWLATGLFFVGPFFVIPDATHHWFALLASMGALACVLRPEKRFRIAAGALCGLAAFFTQTKGLAVLVGIVAYLLWRMGRQRQAHAVRTVIAVVGSFLLSLVALLAYPVARAGWTNFYASTVSFARYYGAVWAGTWRIYLALPPPHSSWLDIPTVIAFAIIYGSVPLVYVVFLVRYWRRRSHDSVRWDELMAIWVVGVSLFLATANAPSLVRLASVTPPALILFAWLLDQPGRAERIAFRFVTIGVLLLAVACFAVRQLRWHATLKTPVGVIAFTNPQWRDTIAELLPRIPPGQPCFGNAAACYLLGDTISGPVAFILPNDYTRPEHVSRLIGDLDSHQVHDLLLRAIFYLPVERGAHDNLGPFRAYLFSHYHLEKMLPNQDELWVRNP